jgi:hypothetical protein
MVMNRPGALAAFGLICLALGGIVAAYGATASYNASLHPNVATTTVAIGTQFISVGGGNTTVTVPTTIVATITTDNSGVFSETVTTYTTYYTTSLEYSTVVNSTTYTSTSIVSSTTVSTTVSTTISTIDTYYTCDVFNYSTVTLTQCT